jgi:outer membrane biosynthesis protein TonB
LFLKLRLLLKESCGILCEMLARLDVRDLSPASYPRAWALFLSLVLHALLVAGMELGHRAGLWQTRLFFSKKIVQVDEETARRIAEAKKRLEEIEREVPLVFVQVDPMQATEQPPDDAKYYSALSSRAANPDTSRQEQLPKIEGHQDKVAKTQDTARIEAQPLQPEPAPPQQEAQTRPDPAPQADPAPQLATRPGDLALPKSAELLAKETMRQQKPPEPPKPPARPRTLAQARQQKSEIAGEKMKQAGGVNRFSLEPSMDVRATPFGAYDAAIIAAIQKRWYDLLDERPHIASHSGKVVLEFRLNSNGQVSDMRVSEYSVTELLALVCQRAIQDPAPFPPWPDDLRRMVGKDHREVRFTFYYN